MNLLQHTTLGGISAILPNILKSYYGLDSISIFKQVGLDQDDFKSSTQRIPIHKMVKLWQLSLKYSEDQCIGLVYANHIQPSALYALGFSWLASQTLKDGLNRLIRFQKMLGTWLAFRLRKTESGYCLYETVKQHDDHFCGINAHFDARIASIFRICQIMMGPELKPIKVSFEHSEPDCVQRFNDYFGIDVTFNAGENSIEFDKTLCEQVAPSSNSELTRINDQLVIKYLAQYNKNDIVTQCRQNIIENLPSSLPKQAVIANNLNLSLRNFQRKLSLAGLSYHELLNQIRHEMSCEYLKSAEYPIIEIAYLLGFSDPSNFSRAFKRWQGQTPYEFRQQIKGII